ncbi:Saccharopine dehydrogenase domain-containing protein [Trichoderma austrokoningii]
MPQHSDRDYDLVLIGATGYTGALTAEHIAKHLPTNLRWAIAGRSSTKLKGLAARLQVLGTDRLQPVIEIVDVEDKAQLISIVKKARLCVSVVSYHHVGPLVIEACIEGATDYIDTAGTIPRIRQWIDDYHRAAELTGVVILISCGALSAPQDLLTWSSVRNIEKNSSLKTRELILSVIQMPSDPSGGTVESMMMRGSFDAKVQYESQQPWYLSPVMGRRNLSSTNLVGVRHDPTLGILSASSLSDAQNRAVVHRTWGLLSGGMAYGSNFQYSEYRKAPSTLVAMFQMLKTMAIKLLLALSPLRAIAAMVLPAPGQGPDPAKEKSYQFEIEAVAIADTDNDETAPRVYSHFAYPGGPYHATAAFLAQGAASLLYVRKLEGGVSGGCLTPAFLGQDLIERIRGVSTDFSTKVL